MQGNSDHIYSCNEPIGHSSCDNTGLDETVDLNSVCSLSFVKEIWILLRQIKFRTSSLFFIFVLAEINQFLNSKSLICVMFAVTLKVFTKKFIPSKQIKIKSMEWRRRKILVPSRTSTLLCTAICPYWSVYSELSLMESTSWFSRTKLWGEHLIIVLILWMIRIISTILLFVENLSENINIFSCKTSQKQKNINFLE